MNDIIEHVNKLIELGITAEQEMICRCLASEQEGYRNLPPQDKAIPKFYHYYNEFHAGKGTWDMRVINNLVDKGLLRLTVDKDVKSYDDYRVTEKYLDIFFEKIPEYGESFEEFWDTYPFFVETDDGNKLNLKSINKEEVEDLYAKHVENMDPDSMLKALKIAKSRGEINNRIDKWLKGEFYDAYREKISDVDLDNIGGIQQSVL